MDFKDYLKTAALEVEQETNIILSNFKKEVEVISPKLVPLVDLFIQSCQGGKRLRGALVKMGHEMSQFSVLGSQFSDQSQSVPITPIESGIKSGSDISQPVSETDKQKTGKPNSDNRKPKTDNREILKIAAAYEIFQTAILAHDDVIDLSPTRRGKPTLYKQLGGDHYGISQTIGLGDVGLYLPIKIITETSLPDDIKNKAINFFAQVVIETGLGEVLDVELPHLNKDREESDVYAIQILKTARYTISGPLILGGILAGIPKEKITQIAQFGEWLGIAFQIQDDILGVFGTEETLGKSVTSDIEEGKNTLLITEALKNATNEQREILDKYYGKGKITAKEIEEIKQVFTQTGALEYSKKKAGEYVKMAKELVPEITDNEQYQRLLEEMGEYLVRRNK